MLQWTLQSHNSNFNSNPWERNSDRGVQRVQYSIPIVFPMTDILDLAAALRGRQPLKKCAGVRNRIQCSTHCQRYPREPLASAELEGIRRDKSVLLRCVNDTTIKVICGPGRSA
jgi:hypothetical protein